MYKNDNFDFKNKKTFQLKLKMFFLPLYPISVFRNIKLIMILSILISLRIILQYTVINIPVINTSFSLAWTPLIIIGWIFGPITGFFVGAITDTISYLIKPTSVWFWMYAIQEPIIGFLSGLFASLSRIQISFFFKRESKKMYFGLIINQMLSFLMITISIIVTTQWALSNPSFEGSSKFDLFFIEYGKYIIIFVNVIFFIAIEITVWLLFFYKRKYYSLLIWILNLTIAITIIFSFILGPISAAEYYKYIYGKESPYVIKYGLIFYLIPRVIKESIKLPIQNLILIILIPITNSHIENVKKNLRLSWQS